MDPISNADRLVLLLRQKLRERARAASSPSTRGDAPVEPTGVRAIAAVEGGDERSLRRALIQHLLVDQFGPDLINDAQFQQLITRVNEAIEADPDAARLLSRLVEDLRS